jgi:parvulin-like peptidyl-prolyl isomerase
MNMQKTVLIVVGVVVVIVGAWYFISSGTPAHDGAVATVNGEEISRGDFDDLKSQTLAQQGVDGASLDEEAQSQLDTQLIDRLVTRELLRQAIRVSGVVASQEDIDAEIRAVTAQFGGDEAFGKILATEGLSEEEFRIQVSMDLAIQAYLEQELNLSAVVATDEEIEKAYAEAVAQDENVPPLEDVRIQVEQLVIQQKQESLFDIRIADLRAEADIEVLL